MRPPLLKSLLRALWANRKYWLFPLLTLVIILLALAVLGGGHAFLPFIYTRF